MMDFLLFVCLFPLAASLVPDGFILDVDVDCNDGVSAATVTVKSDMAVKLEADCNGTDVIDEITGNDVSSEISVLYGPAVTNGSCWFKNPDSDSGMSYIKLHLYYGQALDSVQNQMETYTITCLSQSSKTENATTNDGIETLNMKGIVKSASGLSWTGSIDFKLVDVLGADLASLRDIPIGKKVQLKAEIYGTGATNSMQVSDCLAVGVEDQSVKYNLLTAGCGDGAVIESDEGFETNGAFVRSPFFHFFSLAANTGIQFRCTFTTCSADCDGSSCVSRKKRSISDESGSDSKDSLSPLVQAKTAAVDYVLSSKPYTCLESKALQRQKSQQQSQQSQQSPGDISNYKYLSISVAVLGTLTLLSCLMSVYTCLRKDLSRSRKQTIRCEMHPKPGSC